MIPIKLHTIPAVLYILLLIILVLIFDNPLYTVLMAALCFLNLAAAGGIKKHGGAIAGSLYVALAVFLINPLVSRSGHTVLAAFVLPVAGRIAITLEAVVFGAVMGCKLVAVVLTFFLIGALSDSDDTFSFFSKYAHKVALTFSMTFNIMHRLVREAARVKDVMALRGVDFRQRGLTARVRAYRPLLTVLLVTSLEGSLNMAEALYSKGYGKSKRTCYSSLKLGPRDLLFIFLSLLMAGTSAVGIFSGLGSYDFYPRLGRLEYRAVVFSAFLGMPAAAGAAYIKYYFKQRQRV